MLEFTENAFSREDFIAAFGPLGHISRAKLDGILDGVDADDRKAFARHCRALWTTGMLGWEKVQLAELVAQLPSIYRVFFVTAVQNMLNDTFLKCTYAPGEPGPNAACAVAQAIVGLDPTDYAAFAEAVSRLCAGNTEYFDAHRIVAATAMLPAADWRALADSAERVCTPKIDSHNRVRIITMLAQTKLAGDSSHVEGGELAQVVHFADFNAALAQ